MRLDETDIRPSAIIQVVKLQARIWDWYCAACGDGAEDDENDLTWRQAQDLADEHRRAYHLNPEVAS